MEHTCSEYSQNACRESPDLILAPNLVPLSTRLYSTAPQHSPDALPHGEFDHSDLSLDEHSEASSDSSAAASASPSSAASSAPAAATAERPAKRQRGEHEHEQYASTDRKSRDTTLCARLRWKDPQSGRQREFAAETGASAYHWNTIDQVQIAWKNARAARTALEVQFV